MKKARQREEKDQSVLRSSIFFLWITDKIKALNIFFLFRILLIPNSLPTDTAVFTHCGQIVFLQQFTFGFSFFFSMHCRLKIKTFSIHSPHCAQTIHVYIVWFSDYLRHSGRIIVNKIFVSGKWDLILLLLFRHQNCTETLNAVFVENPRLTKGFGLQFQS